MRTEIGTLQQKLKTTQDTAKDKAKIQEEMETVSQTFKLVLDYIPKELDGQGLLKKISIEAKSAGVQLATFRPGAAIPKDFYDELPMAINLRGTYPQLILFLANISKIPRIINIQNVELSYDNIIDNYPHVKMSGSLVGYRYKEGK